MSNIERNAEIIRWRHAGVGPRETARRMRVSPNVVAGVLKRAALTDPTSIKARGRGDQYAPAFRQMVVEALADMTWRDCIARFGIGKGTLTLWAREFRRERRRAA